MSSESLLDRFFAELPGARPPLPAANDRLGFASAFDVDGLADASTRAAVGAVAHATGTPLPDRLDPAVVRATFATQVAVDGSRPPTWADLSGLYRTGDARWIQFHANFPHHAAGIVERLGCGPDRESVEAAVREWSAEELEETLTSDGMIAAALRSVDEWAQHPHALATQGLPVVSVDDLTPARSRPGTPLGDGGRRLRVLDTTRVLAGPVASQAFTSAGADVIRVGAAHLPTIEIGLLATGAGKRNLHLDLRQADELARFAELARTADVWIDSYRPGALAAFGFDDAWIADNRAGKATVQVSAFDWVGPWAGRRGFDSIVQTTTGIAHAGQAAARTDDPTPLPVQALDYATGFFAAAAAAQLVKAAPTDPRVARRARLSLLRTRNALVELADPAPFTPARPNAEPSATVAFQAGWPATVRHLEVPRPLLGTWPSPPSLSFSAPDTDDRHSWLAPDATAPDAPPPA